VLEFRATNEEGMQAKYYSRFAALLLTLQLVAPASPMKAKLRDIGRIAGLNSHSLTGYGVVAGLANSGDTQNALSSPLILNLLNQLGLQITPDLPNGANRNVAVVAITVEMPAFCRSGDRLDCRVSSLGDAKDLQGGTLLACVLRGPDGKVYASAQGSVLSQQPTQVISGTKPAVVGLVTQGATVATNVVSPAWKRSTFHWELFQPDLQMTARVASALSARMIPNSVLGPGTIELDLSRESDPAQALAAVGDLEVELSNSARIICDERTGTVIAGSEVRLLPITISHRGIVVKIGPEGSTLGSLVESLQKAGATPRDVLQIIRSLHRSGHLGGELVGL
jgi:flagellar P-ring protein precursor FlgI